MTNLRRIQLTRPQLYWLQHYGDGRPAHLIAKTEGVSAAGVRSAIRFVDEGIERWRPWPRMLRWPSIRRLCKANAIP